MRLSSYITVSGKAEGSTLFSFIEMGQLFEKSDFSTSDGDIDNLLDPFNGWRLPTLEEVGLIFGTSRSGSTVNGATGKHYAGVTVTGVTLAGRTDPFGILLFPDEATVTGQAFDDMDDELSVSTSLTLSELSAYIEQGCSFLPGPESYFSSSEMDEDAARVFYCLYQDLIVDDAYEKSDCLFIRLVKSSN